MKETKYVVFSTQKGGAGKTTLTVLVASYLHYVKGYDVAVIDCDFPQYSTRSHATAAATPPIRTGSRNISPTPLRRPRRWRCAC